MAHGEYREEFHVEDHPHAFDRSEPSYSAIAVFGGVTVVLLFFVAIGIQFYFDQTREHRIFTDVLSRDNHQLKALRAQEDRELHAYKYADREKGIVRLPIERAMELTAQAAAANRLWYPTSPYPIKTEEQLQTNVSSPNVQR
jgi:hypothetical protein